jgi:hypothetical protein
VISGRCSPQALVVNQRRGLNFCYAASAFGQGGCFMKTYLVRFIKLWIVWFWFFVLDGLGLVVDTFVPSFSPPRWLYLLIPVIGIIAANVKLFTEDEREIRNLQNRIVELEASLETERVSISRAFSMLQEEISQNIQEFTRFWQNVHSEVPEEQTASSSVVHLATRSIELGPPKLNYLVWEGQNTLLTKALCADQLKQVQLFYGRLGKVMSLCSTLRDSRSEQLSYLRAGSLPEGHVLGVGGLPRPFQRNAPALWQELKQVALELIEEGNPLKEKALTKDQAA